MQYMGCHGRDGRFGANRYHVNMNCALNFQTNQGYNRPPEHIQKPRLMI